MLDRQVILDTLSAIGELLDRVHSRAMTKQLAVLDPAVVESVDQALIASVENASPDIASLVLIAKKGVDVLTESMRLEHERDMKDAEGKQREREAVRLHDAREREAAHRHELALLTKRDNPRMWMGVFLLVVAIAVGGLLEVFGPGGGGYILGAAMAALIGAGGWMARGGQEKKPPLPENDDEPA